MAEPTRLTQLTGVGEVMADRIRLHLGGGSEEAALHIIRRDPYRLMKVPRVGFKTADRIALNHYLMSLDSETGTPVSSTVVTPPNPGKPALPSEREAVIAVMQNMASLNSGPVSAKLVGGRTRLGAERAGQVLAQLLAGGQVQQVGTGWELVATGRAAD